MQKFLVAGLLALGGLPAAADPTLWEVYQQSFRRARYVDLTHVVSPQSPVWKGFGPSSFAPAHPPQSGQPYAYERDGFEATEVHLSTDQLGTQLDPPAHWNPDFPAIDEIPPTFAVRPLVVISIVEQVKADPGYSMTVADIEAWEQSHGKIPEGSVVFVRSDWSRRWGQPGLAGEPVFPGVSLEALQFLHLQRHILFHGHEPLDTDCSPDLKGEAWLLRNGYTQAEGVAHLDQVPEAGALVAIGFARLAGGLGGYARFVAICPPDWPHGVSIDPSQESPLPRQAAPLRWDRAQGIRRR